MVKKHLADLFGDAAARRDVFARAASSTRRRDRRGDEDLMRGTASAATSFDEICMISTAARRNNTEPSMDSQICPFVFPTVHLAPFGLNLIGPFKLFSGRNQSPWSRPGRKT